MVGSTPTRFRQLLDDSTAFVGVEAQETPLLPRVLFPSCSQLSRCGPSGSAVKPNVKKAEHPRKKTNPVSIGRHEYGCKICSHIHCLDIERDFISCKSPANIAKDYGLKDRSSVYRHAHALGLFPKRQRNARAALERLIESAGDVEVNAAAVVGAVRAYASINSLGQWVERSERIDLNALFDRMTRDELEAYARDGSLPEWFTRTVGATAPHSREEKDDA